MKKLLFILLLIPFIGVAQSDTTRYNKSANYGEIFRRVKPYNLLLPTDTTNFKYGFAQKGTTTYIGNGTFWTATSGGGGGSVDSLVYSTWRRLYKVNDSMKVVYSGLYNFTAGNGLLLSGLQFKTDTSYLTGVKTNLRATNDSAVLAAAISLKPNFGDVRDEIADSLNALNRLRAGTSAGVKFQNNSGATVAEYGLGGGTNFDFHGFAGYDANRSSSYTARSFTDKNYVDSSNALNVRLSDTSVFSRKAVLLNFQTASYTLTLNDAGALVLMNVASANTLTLPPNSTVALPLGSMGMGTQYGAGQTTLTAGAGVTLRTADGATRTRVSYSSWTWIKIGTNEYLIVGDII